MMAKPIGALELHYPTIQFLIAFITRETLTVLFLLLVNSKWLLINVISTTL